MFHYQTENVVYLSLIHYYNKVFKMSKTTHPLLWFCYTIRERKRTATQDKIKMIFVYDDIMFSFLSLLPNLRLDLSQEALKGPDLHTGNHWSTTLSTGKLMLLWAPDQQQLVFPPAVLFLVIVHPANLLLSCCLVLCSKGHLLLWEEFR